MESWRTRLKADPVPSLLASGNAAICYFARRDLLGEEEQPIEVLWNIPEVERTLERQLDNGAWKYPGGGREWLRSQEDYYQLET